MSTIPQGMLCTTEIVPTLMQMKYDDHDLLALRDVTEEPYVPMVVVGGYLIFHIPQDWAHGLDKQGLLGLINMPHLGQLDGQTGCSYGSTDLIHHRDS